MYYYQKPPQRETSHYFMPFLMILFLGAILIAGWRLLNTLLLEDSRSTVNERVFLDIEEGSVKAMAADSNEWSGVPDKIYLYRGEKVRTGSDGRATLTFFNESLIRLNQDSELHLQTLKRKKEVESIEADLAQGHLWVQVPPLKDPEASFALNTSLLSVSSRGGLFALSHPGLVYMMEGEARIGVKNQGELLKTYTLGVGQEFMIDEEGVSKLLKEQEVDVIFALSDRFKKSDWYRWNRSKEGMTVVSAEESEERPAEAEEESETEVESDKTPPPIPQLQEPGKNEDQVTLTESAVFIKGSVSEDTAAVLVNDYRLQLYKEGDKQFTYHANAAYGNLALGENEYTIVAEDKAGNRSLPAKITLVLPQAVKNETPEPEPSPVEKEESETRETEPPLSGGVEIRAPNQGENFSTIETEFLIQGVVPEGTAKVVVNDYPLSRFQKGNTQWSYKAYKSLGSLDIGKKNVYMVKAYDEEGRLLGQDSLTIDVESEGAPQITIPTPRNSYLTTLDELVLGGTVGKWVQTLYVNEERLPSYIPGSEGWQYTVKLNVGKNVFRIYGESNGVKTVADQIEITYQP